MATKNFTHKLVKHVGNEDVDLTDMQVASSVHTDFKIAGKLMIMFSSALLIVIQG